MPRQNPYLIENKKPIELVQELKDEYKVPSYEEFIKGYEVDKKVSDNYELEVDSYSDIRVDKSCGPVYYQNVELVRGEIPPLRLDSIFNIEYKLDEGYHSENRRFFRFAGGEYSNVWRIRGNLIEIRDEQTKLHEGDIQIVKQVVRSAGRFSGVNESIDYKRVESEEEEVKIQLSKDIRRFELASRNGERISPRVSGRFAWKHAYSNICYQSLETTISNK